MSKYKFKTTNIRGKQYVEVNERIKFFRQEEEYKNWTISTEFTAMDSEMCVCKCIIADPNQRVIATGHAHEEKSSSHINKTSYVENCETSAVGRALAMMGIGIDTSIASANEVNDAIAKQSSDSSLLSSAPVENIMDKAVGYIKSSTDKTKAFDAIITKYGEQLTEKQVAGLKKFVR
jgi:histone H3/H4